jgi:hypothetical protein
VGLGQTPIQAFGSPSRSFATSVRSVGRLVSRTRRLRNAMMRLELPIRVRLAPVKPTLEWLDHYLGPV